MRKFAVMTFRQADGLSRVDAGLVGRLMNILKGGRFNKTLQPIGTVSFKEDGQQVGYILQLPDFMINWDEFSSGRRRRRLLKYLRLLEKLDIEVICIPYCCDDLPEEAMKALSEGFVVDSAYRMRILALMDSIKHLLRILKERVVGMEVGIWGADGWGGRLLARGLAPSINQMVLGGTDEKELYGLADEILQETGLACPVTTDAAQCLKGKQLVVIADECDLGLVSGAAIVVYAGAMDLKHMRALKSHGGPLWILSGWATLPDGVVADVELLPWETLGVLQALSLREGEMDGVGHALNTVKMRGFILPEGAMTYDTFRIRYLRKRD